jgi:thiamine biosynthesis lipoprotein
MAFSNKTRIYLSLALVIGWCAGLGYFMLRSGKVRIPGNASANKKLYRDNRVLMGTFWEVTSPDKRAAGIVFEEAGRIERLLSKYDPHSETSRLNRYGELKASAETFFIIKKSKEFWQLTSGAFDITVAPLVDLWGFSNHEPKLPSDTQIKETLKLVGSDKIILHENDNVIKFRFRGMKIDLGAIAKGYAIDLAVTRLKAAGVKSCLINAGGQVYALGDKSGSPWKIALQDARKPEIAGTLEIDNESVATSGDYEQFFFKDGKRYCHIIDPRTGYPADSGITSATVIEKSALHADALSTSAFITGSGGIEALKGKFPGARFYINGKRS